MRTLLLFLALPALAFAAPVPKALKKTNDGRLILGRWNLVSVDNGDGSQPPAPVLRGNEYEFREDGTYDFLEKGLVIRTSTYSLDATASPKTLDRFREAEAKSGRLCSFELYELDGDTLTMSSTNGWNEPRPSGFEAVRNKVNVYVHTRVK